MSAVELARRPAPAVADEGLYVTAEQLRRLGRNGDLRDGRRQLRMFLADEREAVIRGPTAKPGNVRIATVADEPAIFALLEMDLAEQEAERVAPVDGARVVEHIHMGTRPRPEQPALVAVIDDEDGVPVAVVGLIAQRWYWSQQWHMTEIYRFVHPDHRRLANHEATDHGSVLLQFSKWATDEFSRGFGYQVHLVLTVMTLRRVRDKMRFVARKATRLGGFFLYPWPDGAPGR